MTIYQALQMNAAGSKNLIRQAGSKRERKKWTAVYLLKNLLTILFCFLFVTLFSFIFGSSNSIAGVVVLLTLLAVRQADFGIKTSHGTVNLFFVFLIFMIGPKVTNLVPAVPAFLVNLVCISGIVILGCHNVIMYNQFTFVLSYLLLQGYDVSGYDFYARICSLAFGAVLCCMIFWIRHRKIVYKRTWKDLFEEFDIRAQRTKWQIKFILGISIGMLIAALFHFPRPMWVGISIMSMMVPFSEDILYRAKRRAPFNAVGCLLFLLLYSILPSEIHPFLGIIGGIGVGFSAGYSTQTMFNVLGALSIAVEMFGLYGAVLIRIAANAAGTLYALFFDRVYEYILERGLSASYEKGITS